MNALENFRGKFEIVDIDQVYPNTWNPKQSIEANAANKAMYEEIKNNLKKKGMYEPIVVRTRQPEHDKLASSEEAQLIQWEILDGFHRWTACKDLGYKKIIIWDLGEVSDDEARAITADSEFLKVPTDPLLVAKLVQMTKPEHYDMLPFSAQKIEEYKKLATFEQPDINKNAASSNKPPRVIMTFKNIEDLENAKVELDEIASRYNAYASVSAGEL